MSGHGEGMIIKYDAKYLLQELEKLPLPL
jgi:hypothetical protein